jgi:hypothetical protein
VVRIDSGGERAGVYRARNTGSGVLLDPSGLLVTASHVLNGRERVAVYLGDAVYAATAVPGADDPAADVALLRITANGFAVEGGCVLEETLAPRVFPAAKLAGGEPQRRFGARVQVVGFPGAKATILRARLVDPAPKVDRFAAGLRSAPYGKTVPLSLGGPAEAVRLHEEALALLQRRLRDGYVFVELEKPGRQPGMSGGAVVLDGQVIGMVVECWHSFERAILICAPLPPARA